MLVITAELVTFTPSKVNRMVSADTRWVTHQPTMRPWWRRPRLLTGSSVSSCQNGVSISGNHDFRVYGWYWGEKYEGPYLRTGASDNYEADANYKYAANLKGKLLLMTGDMDCNNPPAETIRLVDALEKAGKEFDFVLLTDGGHQPSTYAIKRTWDFFVRNLLGADPPAGYRMIAP